MMRIRDWPLRFKLLALLLASSSLPLAIAPLIELRTARALLAHDAARLLEARAANLADNLDAMNETFHRLAVTLATLPLPKEFCTASPAERAALGPAVQSVLETIGGGRDGVHLVALYDTEGTAIAATMPSVVGRNYRFRSYFQRTLAGETVSSDVFQSVSEAGSIPVIAYTAPLRNAEGKVACVSLVVGRGSVVEELVRQSDGNAGEGSFTVLYDAAGIRIAHSSRQAELFHPAGPIEPHLVDAMTAEKRFGESTRALLESPIPMQEEFIRARSASVGPPFRAVSPATGQVHLAASRRLRTVSWTLFSLVPERTFVAPARALVRATLMGGGALMVCALLTGLLLSRAITKPLQELTEAAGNLRAEQTAQTVPVRGRDEVGKLAETFNTMSRNLHQAFTGMEENVRSRTAELVHANEQLQARQQELLAAQAREAASSRALGALAGEGLVEEVVGQALQEAVSLCDSQVLACYQRFDGTWGQIAAIASDGAPGAMPKGLPALAEQAFRSRQPLALPPAAGEAQQGHRLVVPLLAGQQEVGVLVSETRREPRSEDASALAGLALPLALTLLRHQLHVQTMASAKALARSNAELDLQAEELKAQRADLQLKNLEVERADRLKSEFLASMSHELRTPLNAIIGFSELLAEDARDELSPGNLKFVEDVLASGRHLLALINDILDLAKIEAGKVELALEAVEPAPSVSTALAYVRPQASAHKVQLYAESVTDTPVLADPRKLRQVLLNLLSNAVKFSPEGGRVEIGAEHEDGHVRFRVRDEGPGMEPELVQRLFQPFVQGDGALSRKHQGTGLGLAISKRLVEQHGGVMEVTSAPGRGSTFSFTIPTVQAMASPAQAALPDAPPAALAEPLARPSQAVRVLVVEDDPSAVRLLRAYLQDGGYETIEASTFARAMELARELEPAAILLDLGLDGEDGLDLLQELKRDPDTRDIPVIIESVDTSKERGKLLGAVEHLVKPIDRRALLSALSTATKAQAPSARHSVLAIDDDPIVAAALGAVLGPAGYRLQTARLGQEGLALARSAPPALIFIDLMLPDLSGFEVIEALADRPETRAVPIIALTAGELSAAERERLGRRVAAVARKADFSRASVLQAVELALGQRPPAAPARGPTLLVVDDHQLNRELLRTLLERKGYRVILAEGGEEGLLAAQREAPALVLLDLAMPGKDGFAVLEELRAVPSLRGTPVVAVTALAMRGDEERAMAAGFDGYLTKPVNRETLLRTVARLLERKP